jgi:phage FluMu protein Com
MLEQWRCENCGKILMDTNHAPGMVIRIRCKNCETWNTLRVAPPVVERPGGYEKRRLAPPR